jgi:peptide chain release factor 1
MAIDWVSTRERHQELGTKLAAPHLDNQQRAQLQKEFSRIDALLKINQDIERCSADIKKMADEERVTLDAQMKQLYLDEIAALEEEKKRREKDLEDILYPPDELDSRSIFLEIRAGTGGAEAALFAADLMKMYSNYALKKNWHVSIADLSETDLKGIREVILHIEGKNVYQHLKLEAGVHRVQRVPQTETQGRVHTSTASIAVLPEIDEVEININPQDLRVDTYRSGGAGGQHVNKTDSAVRITHIPSGIVVACQEERSQHKNRAKAMKMLQSRLLAAEKEKKEQEVGKERKKMIGSGMRAEKVRTYNFPQNRITDHQIDLTLKNLDMIIEGNLDDLIEPLVEFGRQERRKEQSQIV